jgi:CHAT domain-containing protein/Tfp pilus assembly protein PilF
MQHFLTSLVTGKMKLLGLFFIFTLLLSSALGQYSGNSSPSLFEQAEALYNLESPTPASDAKALRMFLEIGKSGNNIQPETKIKSLLYAGNLLQSTEGYEASKRAYGAALEINKIQVRNPSYDYEAYLYLGTAMYLTGIMDSAWYYFEMASTVEQTIKNRKNIKERDRLYNSLGILYYEAGNYLQANNYFKLALKYGSALDDDFNNFYIKVKGNIANTLLKQKLYDSAIQIFSEIYILNPSEPIAIQNLAHAFLEKGHYDSALFYYRKINIEGGQTGIVAKNDLGRIYMEKGNMKLAEKNFEEAVLQSRALFKGVKNKEEALSYYFRSQLCMRSGYLNEALAWIQQAIREIHLDFEESGIYALPASVSRTISPLVYYQALAFKSKLLYAQYLKERRGDILINALDTYIKAIKVSDFIVRNFDLDESRLYFIDNNKELFEEAIKAAYIAAISDKKYLSYYLYIIESYKGEVLLQNLNSVHSRQYAAIPRELLQREANLKRLSTVYLTQLSQSTNNRDIEEKQDRLTILQVELSRLQKKMSAFDGGFRELPDIENPHDYLMFLRKNLYPRKTLYISYFVSKGFIYGMYLSSNEADLFRVPFDKELKSDFNSFIAETYSIQDGIRYHPVQSAFQLYKKLLQPIEKVTKNYKNWVIIPDEFLYYLPFEALTQSPDKFQYLIQGHNITYHYSLELLLKNNITKTRVQKGDSILAFFPFSYPNGKNLNKDFAVLPFSAQEVTSKSVQSYHRKNATKREFLKNYEKYKFIHFGTHASLSYDSINNWILFASEDAGATFEKLYTHEIYNLNLNGTSLVTLSACETAAGENVSGEGLLSLSRAFIYAGAKGVVSTLYKTDDQVTALIMNRMYAYIEKGKSVNEALRQSKLDFIQSEDVDPKLKSANFWANFVYIGKIENEMDNGNDQQLFIIIFILGCLLIAAIFFFRNYLRS